MCSSMDHWLGLESMTRMFDLSGELADLQPPALDLVARLRRALGFLLEGQWQLRHLLGVLPVVDLETLGVLTLDDYTPNIRVNDFFSFLLS